MDEEVSADDFDWSPLGEAYWDELGDLGYDRRQRKFVCAYRRGASLTEAARLAGFSGDEDSIRQAGHRASKTNWCQTLLKLAAAQAGLVDGGPVSVEEGLNIASSLARHGDPRVRLQALDQIAKLNLQKQASTERYKHDQGHTVLEALQDMPEYGALVVADLYFKDDRSLKRMPFLNDLAPLLARDFPLAWERYCRAEPALEQLGKVPPKTVAQIVAENRQKEAAELPPQEKEEAA